MRYFDVIFLEEAEDFIAAIKPKTIKKILYNIDLAGQTNDPRLFKKLKKEVWEFRAQYERLQIRLLAFWDKTNNEDTLVVATHGFIKKVDKVSETEIDKTMRIREQYFNDKKRK